ncbi:CDP-diacylglycerol--serine O-phosphatidyltransferase [Methanothermococcus okinawensis]|uniref:CDP-diacylglycerol--serine O-phosphatidyltransferase n=1 Tax=Methanothermococcus okinawensis (strain DSM 14208 / JCM 11175 / IH1) TaxID=647113 RepID=F8AJU2_METOI|nr:CDP-diacylglycerol--serine O-phosphatidyltransferase [Methanothermococcus okinawensis]AEH07293.1 CDP-diacylglycerol/serine O-phosphatidyltransferase [Methanothermococcus okinawensis IH1]
MFKIKNIITISDYVTVINIVFGMLAILFQDFRFIYLAIVFDAMDGYVARKTNTVSDFGAELDSICDVVSFGVAPAYLLYYYFEGTFGLIASLIFLICGALRLARFGILDVRYFVGLPIPAGALILSVTCELFLKYNIVNYNLASIIVPILAIIFGLLMISDIRYPKYPNKIGMIIFAISLILALFGIFEPLAICAIGYVGYGILKWDIEK